MRSLAALIALSALAACGAVAFLWALGRARQIGYEEATVVSWAEVQGLIARGRLRLVPEASVDTGDYGPIPAGGPRAAGLMN
jgi:hypothetical protein